MLNVQTKKLGTLTVLSVQGKVVIGHTEVLSEAVRSLTQMKSLILDLSHVTLIDAHGLGVLLQLREQAQAKGIRIQLTNVSRPVRRIMQIARLDTVFQIGSGIELAPAQQTQLAA